MPLRSLSVIVASPAISPANSATLTLYLRYHNRRTGGDTLSINGNTGNAGDTGFVGLMESAPIDDQIDKVSWFPVRDLRSSTKEGSISCLGCFVTGSRVCGLIRLTTSFSRLSR